ncbi:hypothetical protein HFP57_05275 [Parasphingopyxis algicola]|nr:PilZ domain-containing protein [Parasphingopyxis algicola]QLC24489.1 hypothetical protein HFP57_05275 [Parasphingopyxis algicola]
MLTKTALQDDGGATGDARVRNLSEKGLGGVTDIPLSPGQTMTIMLNGIGQVQGRIAWVNDKSFGMEFDEPIDLGKLELAKRQPLEKPTKFNVARRFRPVEDYKRPGFTHRR